MSALSLRALRSPGAVSHGTIQLLWGPERAPRPSDPQHQAQRGRREKARPAAQAAPPRGSAPTTGPSPALLAGAA
ncbi:hypothetical protein NDU88_005870 [Pleurodeles waltl]|uniref:Uncharacterized protein n=1 Tax=Pleurodeles waltl TaxID=8319 RepID=A0AAV7MDC8_PLEWA|nr:hypothetical protein NDU88_005870 [Pleurodeles waltl]